MRELYFNIACTTRDGWKKSTSTIKCVVFVYCESLHSLEKSNLMSLAGCKPTAWTLTLLIYSTELIQSYFFFLLTDFVQEFSLQSWRVVTLFHLWIDWSWVLLLSIYAHHITTCTRQGTRSVDRQNVKNVKWSWKSKSAKECAGTHLPNGLAPKLDGAQAGDWHPTIVVSLMRKNSLRIDCTTKSA